jgi:hypothetical protein
MSHAARSQDPVTPAAPDAGGSVPTPGQDVRSPDGPDTGSRPEPPSPSAQPDPFKWGYLVRAKHPTVNREGTMTSTITQKSRTTTGRWAATLSAACLALICAAMVWMAGAGTALAPEPARLNSTLYSSGATSATYVNTLSSTSAYFLSSSWTPSSLPVGAPCSTTFPRPAGTTLSTVVVASGSYRKCQ